ncbi:MAG: protein-disulfide reductase DsbD family protein [Hyphomicrobiaceae bacterium]|nr:protein-disulfide reductase DsbD family protein [Hyphomicrobiaceae bacterium]
MKQRTYLRRQCLRRTILFGLACLVVGGGAGPSPANAQAAADRKVEVELIAPVTAIEPGKPFRVGLRQTIARDWHTYWKNPGDSGEPTRIAWALPPGFTASDIHWPLPEAIPVGPLMNYGFSDAVLLPVTMTPPADLAPGPVKLAAVVDLLVCKDICIPEQVNVTLSLDVQAGPAPPTPSPHADVFAAAERASPIPSPWPVSVEITADALHLDVVAAGLDPDRIARVQFFASDWGVVDHAAPQTVSWQAGGFSLALQRGDLAGQPLNAVEGLLVVSETIGTETVRNGFAVRATPGQANASATPAALASWDAPIGLWQALLLAMLGGLVLNLMPCVLPILSLKVMALAQHGDRQDERKGARLAALAYLTGVLVCFTALGLIVVSLRAAGETVGWGFQFQSPAFVLGMAALFLALGLSLSGVFDIGGSLVGAGDGLARRTGAAGSFFTGVLATVAATPCTAPFMGAAIGYAVTRPAAETVAVMLALGLGFALPVVAIALAGVARHVVPRPGLWMVHLKQVLAFPLYATAAWLVWVLSLQAGSDGVLAAAYVLTGVALASWLVGQAGVSRGLRTAAVTVVLAIVGAAAVPLVETATSTGGPEASAARGGKPAITAYSEQRVDDLRRSGQNVFVNLTAAWCITCKVNERVALDTDGVRGALASTGTAYLTGDWTRRDEAVTRLLAAHDRAGVPLYLLYPADPDAAPVVLPQLLTEAIVVAHLTALPKVAAANPSQ